MTEAELADLMNDLTTDMANVGNSDYYGNCRACNKPINQGEEKLKAEENIFHAKCFKCTGCSSELAIGSPYNMIDNKVFCQQCYIAQKCDQCVRCEKFISDRKLMYDDKPYHATCFTCSSCEKSLDGIPFKLQDGVIRCSDCHDNEFSHKCTGCSKSIIPDTDDFTCINVEGNRWHNECFNCDNCNKNCSSSESPGHVMTKDDDKKEVLCMDHCKCKDCT
eukprot:Pgem_evm1s6289